MTAHTRTLIDRAEALKRRSYVARVQAQGIAAWSYVLLRDATRQRATRRRL